MKSYQQFFAELKRRKVFRVMAVYGATAFVVLQVADLLAEGMGLSDQVLRVTTFLVLIGFPIAIVLAWAFETTPDGVRLTEDATDEEIEAIIAQPAGRRWSAGLLALAGAALLFGGWWLGRQGSEPGLNLSVPEAMADGLSRVAVLPFEDIGGNLEDSPFVRGMHIAVQNKLEGLADLRVISPASVRAYEGTTKTTREIATELRDVDFLLRGTIGRSGDQARVSARLIDVVSSENVWTDEWTREVTAENLFDIQSQIARRIADAMQANLSPEEIERLEAGLSTTNTQAINAYLRARETFWSPDGDEGFDEIVAHLEQAVALAPEFVEAWSFLAWQMSFGDGTGRGDSARALEAVEHAESLAPSSLEAIKARAWYLYYVEDDFPTALALMREAERRAPSDTDVLWGIAYLQHRLGKFAEGNQTMKQAVNLDPLNAGLLFDLAIVLGRVAKWDAAGYVLERALAVDPSNAHAQRYRVNVVKHTHRDPGSARRLAAEIGLKAADFGLLLSDLALFERDYDGAARVLAQIPYDSATASDRREWVDVLVQSAWVEQLRGGDASPLLDSLRAFVGPDSAFTGAPHWQAAARILIGQEEAGTALLRKWVEDAGSLRDQVLPSHVYWLAGRTYAQFGKTEEALRLLELAVARPATSWHSAAELHLDPRYDSLRDDPRFDALIARQESYEAAQAREADTEDWLP